MRVAQKILHGTHQEGAKPATLPNRSPDPPLLQKTSEELLGQILCLIRSMTTLPDERINGQPVSLAKSCQCFARAGGICFTGNHHLRPVGALKATDRWLCGRRTRRTHSFKYIWIRFCVKSEVSGHQASSRRLLQFSRRP